jgi:hypothetical protein
LEFKASGSKLEASAAKEPTVEIQSVGQQTQLSAAVGMPFLWIVTHFALENRCQIISVGMHLLWVMTSFAL